ncbi:MAG: hypothetical protein G01um101470_765, partial [Parcubacteria group bacterium Gr01-1014_70]
MTKKFETFDNREATETAETSFEEASKAIRDNGYRSHREAHDKEGRDPKTYHTSEHPRTMEGRAEQMANTFRLSPEERAAVKMEIAWHDTTIEYDKADPNNLLAMIRRHRGAREGDTPKGADGNEGQSARSLEQEMREVNRLAKREIFTEEQIHNGVWAIDATYPDVNFGQDFKGAKFKEYPYYDVAIAQNPDIGALFDELETQGINKGPLFFQPHLEKPLEEGQKVPKEVLVVALSDLGAAGTAEKEVFFKEGANIWILSNR